MRNDGVNRRHEHTLSRANDLDSATSRSWRRGAPAHIGPVWVFVSEWLGCYRVQLLLHDWDCGNGAIADFHGVGDGATDQRHFGLHPQAWEVGDGSNILVRCRVGVFCIFVHDDSK